ncbi:MAG: hypothetical protein ACYTKD_18675 [Planctomycetota bacterium]|jgi:hypothetical protein
MKYEVLYRAAPSWLVGETSEERDARLRRTVFTAEVAESAEDTEPDVTSSSARSASSAVEDAGVRYPGDYAGRVIAIRPVADVESGRLPSLKQMSSKARPVVMLELTDEEVRGLASRRMKILTAEVAEHAENSEAVPTAPDGGRSPDEAVPFSASSAPSAVSVVAVTFDDRFGAVAAKLRDRHPDPQAWEAEDRAAREEAIAAKAEAEAVYDRAVEEWQARRDTFARELVEANRTPGAEPAEFPERPAPPSRVMVPESAFERAVADLTAALPGTVTHSGTGLYAAKVAPAHNDDAQSGAPAGQVVTLAGGGLGTSNAFAGGYVTNATRSETRAIVSHTDSTVTLEGDLASWADTDDLDVYDAWSTIGAAYAQLETDQGSGYFAAPQVIRVHPGDYDERLDMASDLLRPTWAYYFKIEVGGDSGNVTWVDTLSGTDDVLYMGTNINFGARWILDGKDRLRIGSATSTYRVARFGGRGYSWVYDTTFWIGTNVGVRSGTGRFFRCTFERKAEVAGGGNREMIQSFSFPEFHHCVFDGHYPTITATERAMLFYNHARPRLLGCVVKNFSTNAIYAGWAVDARNCTFYNIAGAAFIEVEHRPTWHNCIFHTVGRVFWDNEGAHIFRADRNRYHNITTEFAYIGGSSYADLAAFQAYVDFHGNSPDANSTEGDPGLTDPANDDFSLTSSSACRNAGIGAGADEGGMNGVAFDEYHPDIGPWSSGPIAAPARPSVAVTGVAGAEVTVETGGAASASHRAELVRASTGEVVDYGERSGPGEVALTAPELSARYVVVASCSNAAGRSLPSAPEEVFVSEGGGPFEELRSEIVSRLAAHSGLAALLGTDDTGAVPIYASHPATARRVPSLAYALTAVPDAEFDRPGRWVAELALESWGGGAGANDSLVSAADEVLHLEPFAGTGWAVKRIARTGDVTRWEPDGDIEVRRTTWSITVDRVGT